MLITQCTKQGGYSTLFCFAPGRKECKDAPGARLLLRCPKPPRTALAPAGFGRGAAPCSLFSASWGTSGFCPSPPIPLVVPKIAQRALPGSLLRCPKPPSAAFAAAGFDRGANPCSLLPALRALAGVAFCKRRAKTLERLIRRTQSGRVSNRLFFEMRHGMNGG